MEIIVPAAGLSTRFPGMRPKYTLTDHSGALMIERAIAPYVGKHNITIGILKQHHDEYSVSEYVTERNANTKFVILPEVTKGPADTVRQIIDTAGIAPAAPILVKDCDSFFDHADTDGNYVCTSNIANHEVLKKLSSKSFVKTNSQGIVTDIVEKQVVSPDFCVGGYKFESAKLYCDTYDQLATAIPEVFVSHVIQACLGLGHVFLNTPVNNYVDVGTAEDWFAYNDLSVIFCDIDGTVIHAQSRENFGEPVQPLIENCQLIQHMVEQGHQLIFTTARPFEQHYQLTQQLTGIGFKNFKLITGLKNVKRVLINDYNHANPFPRAIAVNVPRDSDTLKDFL
jgi:hypothetical protein